MKKIALLIVVLFLGITSTTFAKSELEDFNINGFYHEIVNGDDFLSLSFSWKFDNPELSATTIAVSVYHGGSWYYLYDFDPADIPLKNKRMGYVFTELETYKISDVLGKNLSVEEFFKNPTVEFRTEIFHGLKNEEGRRMKKNFTFKRPKCKCVVEEEGKGSIIAKGDVFKTNVSAVHENSNERITFDLQPLNGSLLEDYPGHKFPEGINLNSETGEISYISNEIGKYAFLVSAIDEDKKDYFNVVSFEVSATASVDYNISNDLLYPNPANQVINLTSDVTSDNIVIYDINGNLVKAFNSIEKQINVSDLPNGAYMLINGNQLQNFIINR